MAQQKLYKEEDVLKMLRRFHTLEMNVQLCMLKLKPIEIPEISDEEITKLADEYILYNSSKKQWVIEGMRLYREQVKNKLL